MVGEEGMRSARLYYYIQGRIVFTRFLAKPLFLIMAVGNLAQFLSAVYSIHPE
jgi:hypothetical protein